MVATPVHPRWRGERGVGKPRDVPAIGSSPLARGTPYAADVVLANERFIPAGAGNANIISQQVADGTVHPRWRGERCSRGIPVIAETGSSPLARGTLGAAETVTQRGRFIPAGAGNAPDRDTVTYTVTVHPRWRGERPPPR